jgi:hypothetical protein
LVTSNHGKVLLTPLFIFVLLLLLLLLLLPPLLLLLLPSPVQVHPE